MTMNCSDYVWKMFPETYLFPIEGLEMKQGTPTRMFPFLGRIEIGVCLAACLGQES